MVHNISPSTTPTDSETERQAQETGASVIIASVGQSDPLELNMIITSIRPYHTTIMGKTEHRKHSTQYYLYTVYKSMPIFRSYLGLGSLAHSVYAI